MKERNTKIRKYKKPFMNIGMIIFGVIFIYVAICVILSFQTTHVVRYQVKEGSLATDKVYRGIIIRDETVIYSQAAGYVNFYAREGARVGKNGLVYIVDETGKLSENLAAMSQGENSLSDKELSDYRSQIIEFSHNYDSKRYSSTYDCKYSLKNSLLKLANANMLNSIHNTDPGTGFNAINYAYAPKTGIVSYWIDGYEDITPSDVTETVFAKDGSYEKKQILSNSLMEANEAVYKLSTNENWSLVIPVEADRGARLVEEGYIKVRFLKNQYESWAEVKLLNNADGNTYLQLMFNNSMITFVNERFLDVELIVEDEKGLKIPVSSIVQKEFFLIPDTFVIQNSNNGMASIMRQCYLEDGTISSEFLDVEVYNYDSESKEYYLDSSILNAGDILCKKDGQETYTVSKRATLIGVYNMNKGYAEFKQINILYQNDEYAIVKSNTKYGLSVYDYIVLDAETVSDNQFIQ
ncbi:MAG: HlyD family efflux transporter periplasmic adaptor subunit [Acetatifactor sp.]